MDPYFELLFESPFSAASVSVALSHGLSKPIVGLSWSGLGNPEEFRVFSIAPRKPTAVLDWITYLSVTFLTVVLMPFFASNWAVRCPVNSGAVSQTITSKLADSFASVKKLVSVPLVW